MTTPNEFIEAAKQASIEQVRALLADDPSLADAEDAQGISAVLWAAYFGRSDVAEAIAGAGAKLNLYAAAALGRTDLVRAALSADKGAASSCSPDGFTALGLAAFFGHTGLVRMLLDAGADPNFVSKNRMRVTPLHSAVANRDATKAYDMATLLVKHGANVNVVQEGGWTPLQQAAAHGYARLVEFLLKAGADVSARAADGRTAYDLATGGKHAEAAELLQSSMAATSAG
jgi:ankyrin repeat protein